MAIANSKLFSAMYTSENRDVVEAVWRDNVTGEKRVEMIEVEPGNALWEELLEHTDLEELQEMTNQMIFDMRKGFENDVIDIARREGLVWDVNQADAMELYKGFAKAIFDNEWEVDKLGKEKLFCFKLQVFELPAFKKSKNKKLKSDLRKAKNMIDAVIIACELHKEIYPWKNTEMESIYKGEGDAAPSGKDIVEESVDTGYRE